ncbi:MULTISPECIES: hypothetical protein [Pseudomonas syringae group]|uniref:hypothetical protein n=1 Tax=Pseudomonas syringae group TaxID=136849 RepID=UPI0005177D62|nr:MULTISPECIES: hypothetical protein [Pseudomonas syringae group]
MIPLTLGATKDKNLQPIFKTVIQDSIDCYPDFVNVINNQIRNAIRSMVRSRNQFEGMGEDQITYHIISKFEDFGFNASHDKQVGGHVDITIEYDDYIWLAEAKKHSSYLTLQRGWYQLTTRYMTGVEQEDHGAFLIYNFNKDAANVTLEWRQFLIDFHPDVELGAVEGGLNFASLATHEGTGLKIKVNHYNIPLYFDPKDRA